MNPSFIDRAFTASRERSKTYERLAERIGWCEASGGFKESLLRARSLKGYAIIVEYKRCSPSSGFITYRDPHSYIKETLEGSDAYSVLTEPYWFCGSLELLGLFSRYRPSLAKDFISSKAQVKLSACMGASAVLLIDHKGVSLEELAYAALDLGLDVLIETSDHERAVELADLVEEAIIGINSRNLRTLQTDFDHMIEELRKARSVLGSSRIIVAESGIDNPQKALRAFSAGADAILIGTSVMKDPRLLGRIRAALEGSKE